MTLQEFKRVQCLPVLEPFWIGQGYGYKNMSPLLRTESWSGIPDDEIIYIPESAYDNGFLDPFGVYTKRDFIELAGSRARELFDYCDWQSPEAAWNEIEGEGEGYCEE